ncbi:MAG: ExbD/TolR family protein [Rickettsiales bacterium]
MAFDFERKRRPMQEINLTALIDIVFHLLIFVMFTTTFVVSESMELSLPSGKTKPGTSSALQVMRIQIEANGGLQVDAATMNNDGLSAELARRLGVDPETKIAIFTTTGVTVQQLVSIMDIVYLTGGRNVQVDKAEG